MHIHIQAYTPLYNFSLTVLFTEQWGSNEVSYIYLSSSKRTFMRQANTNCRLLITFANIFDPDQNAFVVVAFFTFLLFFFFKNHRLRYIMAPIAPVRGHFGLSTHM